MNAGEADFTAEKSCELATDREAKTSAAVFARSARVGLLKSLEDEPLLLRRDADASILDGKRDDLLRLAEDRMINAPALRGEVHAHVHVTVRGKFHCVGQQVF